MIDRNTRSRLLDLDDLPTIPVVMTRVLETVADERSSASDLTAILEQDYAISARVLRLANSAFYGTSREIDTIRRAIVVIGFDAVRLLALATSVFDVITQNARYALDLQDFWMHSLGAGKAAQFVTQLHGSGSSPEACFTAGLLHDVGKYVLELGLGDRYADVVREAGAANRPLAEVERERLDTTHAEVGGWIAGHWGFPPMIRDTIEHHYRYGSYRGDYRTEVLSVALADVLSRRAEFGYAGDPRDPSPDPKVLKGLGLTATEVAGYVDELAACRDETRRLFDVLAEG
ncbi:MAG: HDOD domain-containing protein [Candidatus Hydrogenedentes bacterium]|nr:HDOD domain-containing protein [Candidatus Hydrogenedentota bacterium]